jgi:hypothetical protein
MLEQDQSSIFSVPGLCPPHHQSSQPTRCISQYHQYYFG